MKWTERRLDHVARVTWTEIRKFTDRDCCVLATRVLTDVLAELGERQTYSLVVTALLLPPATAAHSRQHGCHAQVIDCPAATPDERRAVVLGADPSSVRQQGPDQSWQGHLVLAVQRRFIVDMSVSQATQHPEIGLSMDEPLVMPTTEAFLRGRVSAALTVQGGSRFVYQARPHSDSSWKHSPDWCMPAVRDPLVCGAMAVLHGREPRYPVFMEAVRNLVGQV